MTKELLQRIVLLKQKTAEVKTAPIYQKANRAEACIEEAIFVIEELATELARLEEILDELVTHGVGIGEIVVED